MSHHVHYSPVLGGQLLSPGISQPAETCQLLIDSYPPKKAEPCQCRRIFASWNNFISGVVLDSNGFHKLVSVACTRFWKLVSLGHLSLWTQTCRVGLMWPPNRFRFMIICSDPTRQRECFIYQVDKFHMSAWKAANRLCRTSLQKVCSFIPSYWQLLVPVTTKPLPFPGPIPTGWDGRFYR